MSTKDKNRTGEIGASSAVRNFMASLGGDDRELAGFVDWTDEQWAEHDAKVAAKREEESRHREYVARPGEIRQRYLEAGWPVRAFDAALEADELKPAVAKIATWNCAEENVLVLSGPPGCGKTVAACWWARKRSDWPAQFLRATTFAASSRYDRETRDSWFGASALVLDDLGSEYADTKGNFLVDLDELVDVFYGDKKPLLITTNCTAEDFKTRYGARVVDRIRECGTFASIAGVSLRRKP